MLVDLVHDEHDALLRFRQRFREKKALLRLDMIVIHDIENEIRQMYGLLRREAVRRIRRINARRVHQDDALGQGRRPGGNLDALSKIKTVD